MGAVTPKSKIGDCISLQWYLAASGFGVIIAILVIRNYRKKAKRMFLKPCCIRRATESFAFTDKNVGRQFICRLVLTAAGHKAHYIGY